jgi:hypothetical protein
MHERSVTVGDMSTGASRPPWALVRTAYLSGNAAAVAGLTLLCAALAFATWRTWGDIGTDVGYDLLASSRVADGELPYSDFIYYYGPLGLGVLGLGAWLTGTVVGAAISVGVATATLIVLATYALARTQVRPLGAALAAGITAPLAFAPNNLSFVLPHSFSASFAILSALGFLLGLGRYAASGRQLWVLAAGTSAGFVTLTRPEFTVAVVAAAALWLALRATAGMGGLREAALIAAPLVAIPAGVYGTFLTQVSVDRLVLENLYPLDPLDGGGKTLLRSYAPFTLSSFGQIGLKTALYAAGAAGLVLVAWLITRPGRRLRGPLIAAASLALTAAAVASIARPETLRYYLEFAYGWIPAGAIVAVLVLLWRFSARSGAWSSADQVALAGGVVLAVLAVKTYNAFLFHAPEPQLAVYAAPFGAVFLARLHLAELARTRSAYVLAAAWLGFLVVAGIGLTLKDASEKSAEVSGPRGWLRDDPADARVYVAALGWIERETRPGDYILVGPQLQALYALSGRRDPLEELSLLPGALGGAKGQAAAASELDRRNVRLVVIDARRFPEFDHSSFGRSFSTTLATRIADRFERVAVLRGTGRNPKTLVVWLRRGA